MNMRRGTAWAEEGFSLVEILVGIAILAILAGSILFATTTFGRSLTQSAAAQAATTNASTLVDSLERDSRSSIAIFTPAVDVANHPNSDGHEVGFYARDARGSAGSFQSYCFKSSSYVCGTSQAVGALGIYRYAWNALPQNGGTGATYAGTIGENITSFSAKTVAASALLDPAQNPTTATYFAKIGVTSATDVARTTGFPGVLAGNRVTFVTFSNSVATRALHLLAGSQPTHRNIIVATYTPPPNPMTVSGGNATLNFVYPLAAAQAVTFVENNYGTRSTTPAQVYNVIGTTCGTNATYSPGTITPASDGTGSGSMTVQPEVKAQPAPISCVLTVADNSAQSQNVTVNIGQTYSPTASSPAAGRPGQNGIFAIGEQNYPSLAFSVGLAGPCNSPTMVSGTQTGGSYLEQVRVAFTAAGVCTITATDGYGQTTSSSVSVYNDPVYTLLIPTAPAPDPLAVGGTATFTATAAQSQSSVPSGTPNSVPVLIAGNSGPCTTTQLDPTTFSFTALGAGSCSMTIAANAGGVSNATTQNSPATVTVMVSAVATPTPTPTPVATPTAVGTPTPAPTPTPVQTPTPPPQGCTQNCGPPTPPASMMCVDVTGQLVPATVGYFYTVPDPRNGNRCTMIVLFVDNNGGTGAFWFPEPSAGSSSAAERVIPDLYPKRSQCFGIGVGALVSGQNGPDDGTTTCVMYWQPPNPQQSYRTNWTIQVSSGAVGNSGTDFNNQSNVATNNAEALAYVSLLAAGSSTWTNYCGRYGYFTGTGMFFFAFAAPTGAGTTYDGFPLTGTPATLIKLSSAPSPGPCVGMP
jgi:prepilin-type N-terminal cleavage/methylation domain-containing protein